MPKALPGYFAINNDKIRLFNDDCISGMHTKLNRESVDVVVTSPPYNLGIKYGHYDDNKPKEEYLQWIEDWAKAIHIVLSGSGSVFLNIGAKPSDPFFPFEVLNRVINDNAGSPRFFLQNVIHWIKSIAIEKAEVGAYPGITQDTAIGHFKPINSPRFLNDCHEYIFHLTKTKEVPLDRLAVGVEYQDKSNVARWGSKIDKRCRGNTWFVPYKTIHNRSRQRPHPATFPTKIPEMCVKLHGIERTRLVLDPFLGIGSSALACQLLDVNFAGFEIDTDYFQTACENIQHESKMVNASQQINFANQAPSRRLHTA
jgi:site-specific DNA-methyltransferase (adenine-specific)